ncbi:MAG: hypothetical protein K0S33_696 [Bacteroidetes bacterium]|nr:hypothetical protein [Bacteroidota bacterium]
MGLSCIRGYRLSCIIACMSTSIKCEQVNKASLHWIMRRLITDIAPLVKLLQATQVSIHRADLRSVHLIVAANRDRVSELRNIPVLKKRKVEAYMKRRKTLIRNNLLKHPVEVKDIIYLLLHT